VILLNKIHYTYSFKLQPKKVKQHLSF